MTEAVKPPHQPADHRADFCRVCCLPADEANETCIPYPGNPRRPFLSPQITFAFFDKNHPLHAGPPICSAPPDDDPVLNHILVFINEFTGAGKWRNSPEPQWKRSLAAAISSLMPRKTRERVAKMWSEESRQTLYDDGLITETPFNRFFMAGRYIAGAETEDDGRTAVIISANGNRTRLRPSRRAKQFADAVNQYAGNG